MSDVIKDALAGCGDHAEIRRQTTYKRRVSVISGSLVNNLSSKSAGASARVYKNGVWGFASIGNTDESSVPAILRSARENAFLLDSRRPKNKGPLVCAAPVRYAAPQGFRETAQKDLIDFALALDAYIGKT